MRSSTVVTQIFGHRQGKTLSPCHGNGQPACQGCKRQYKPAALLWYLIPEATISGCPSRA